MRCPECKYELTENEKLLCLVPDGHYCPRCWARIKADPTGPEPSDLRSGRKPRNPSERIK